MAWAEGTLWVGQYRESEIRQIDPETGKVLTRLPMPEGTEVSGLESDGGDLFYAGGGGSGRIRAMRKPRRRSRR